MKRSLPVLLLSVLLSGPARADSVVIGASCDQLGASMMTSDHQNIAVCLENTEGKTVWKSSTSGTDQTMISGWPDAILCTVTNPNWGLVPFYLGTKDTSGSVHYRALYNLSSTALCTASHTGYCTGGNHSPTICTTVCDVYSNYAANYGVIFSAAGAFAGYEGLTATSCSGKTMAQLVAAGAAFSLAAPYGK